MHPRKMTLPLFLVVACLALAAGRDLRQDSVGPLRPAGAVPNVAERTAAAASTDVRPPALYPKISPRMQIDGPASSSSAEPSAASGKVAHMTNVHLIKQLYSSRSPRGSSAGVTTAGADVGTASLVKACPAGQCLTFQGIHGHCSYMPAGGCPSGILYQSTDPIMHAPLQLVPIFYGKSWTAHQISLVKTFLSGLGGSTWMAMNAIYSDTSSYGANNPGMNSPYSYNYNTAAHPLPLGTSLDYAGVVTLVKGAITAMHTTPNDNTIYLLLTGPEISQKFSDGSGFCTDFCGWHTNDRMDGANLIFAWIGNAATKCRSACIADELTDATTPNGDLGIDGMFSVMAHEITEAASDPQITTWLDLDGNENADKCAWQFKPVLTNLAGKAYNTQLANGMICLIQKNWVPYKRGSKKAGCYLS